MTQTLPLPLRAQNAAHALAVSNYAANRAALATLEPAALSALTDSPPENEWIFARDGSLTVMLPDQQWWGGCSLPRRAGQFMFKTLEIRGVVGCFLAPIHAAHIRIALDKLEAHQAILAIVPDPHVLQVLLHCENFAADFCAHRLWFAAGENWESDLAQILTQNPGLPTPGEFIRAISADNTLPDQLISPAQKAFALETTRRSAEVQSILTASHQPPVQRTPTRSRTFFVVAPSHFRLWNDAPMTLARILGSSQACPEQACAVRLFDSDNPASASPLGLARGVVGADAVLTANLARADLPAVIPAHMPIITWITLPRIPAPAPAAPRDALLLADPAWLARARAQGWPDDRIQLAAWPAAQQSTSVDDPAISHVASLIADTHALVPPKKINEFSSHLLLWDLIDQELRRDPFQLKNDIDAYLTPRVARFQIDPQSFNKSLFIEHLIVPAYQQAVARALIAQGVPIRLYGNGWDQIESLAAHAGGPITSRDHFNQVVAGSGALVHAWPSTDAHPIDVAGRPVIRPASFQGNDPGGQVPPLTPEIILALLV
jgi:hypothetical protein